MPKKCQKSATFSNYFFYNKTIDYIHVYVYSYIHKEQEIHKPNGEITLDKITISIKTTNDAFKDAFTEESEGQEIARILRKLADKLEDCYYPDFLKDLNGNKVGNVEYE